MTTEQHERDTYEERLLSELRAYVAERPRSGTPVAVERRRRLPKVALAGVAAAAVAGGVVVATGGDTASAAYAVEPQGDGSVTVEIRKLEDAEGLQSKLREAGVPAVVKYLPIGKSCKEGWFEPARDPVQRATMSGSMVGRAGRPDDLHHRSGHAPARSDRRDHDVHGQRIAVGRGRGRRRHRDDLHRHGRRAGPRWRSARSSTAPPDDLAPMPVGAGGGSLQTHGDGAGAPPDRPRRRARRAALGTPRRRPVSGTRSRGRPASACRQSSGCLGAKGQSVWRFSSWRESAPCV